MWTPASNLLTTIIILLPSVTQVLATCRVPPCGDVQNNSPWRMKWADLSGGPHYCDVYNWHVGSDASPAPNMAHRRCSQGWVEVGEHKGGFAQRLDVDGFCFHDRRYRIRWGSAAGATYTLQPGVWTKISDAQTATCSQAADGMASCFIL
ncbi:hypothetical protein BKA63DRAFT_559217 [Paraphoma chrysanthemicola]|nr:hypothetical protein BKA63DRAFT_559217 [Paraphoma chrysanthemicola]